MKRVKQLALDALKCPVRHAVDEAFNRARLHAWQEFNNHRIFVPQCAFERLVCELGELKRHHILEHFALEVLEDVRKLSVKAVFEYRANGLVRRREQQFTIF